MGRSKRDGLPQPRETYGDGSALEAAAFISDSARDLATLARVHRLDVLANLLDMAKMEADDRRASKTKRRAVSKAAPG